MRRTIGVSVVLTLIVASSLLSQEKRQDARRPRQPQQAVFQQIFTLRGVEFTEEQQAKVDEIRKNYLPKLMEIQGRQGRILTDKQRRRLGEALRAAREAGKRGREFREAVDADLTLTDEQKEEMAGQSTCKWDTCCTWQRITTRRVAAVPRGSMVAAGRTDSVA